MGHDDDLELIFASARRAAVPSQALVARVLADADAAQPAPVRAAAVAPAAVGQGVSGAGRGLLAALFAPLGGGPVAAGLALAAVAGVFIGYAGPVTTDWLAGAVSSDAGVEMMSASDLFLSEG